jgi:hypothetical protein
VERIYIIFNCFLNGYWCKQRVTYFRSCLGHQSDGNAALDFLRKYRRREVDGAVGVIIKTRPRDTCCVTCPEWELNTAENQMGEVEERKLGQIGAFKSHKCLIFYASHDRKRFRRGRPNQNCLECFSNSK